MKRNRPARGRGGSDHGLAYDDCGDEGEEVGQA